MTSVAFFTVGIVLALVKIVFAQVYDRSGQSLTSFPTDIPPDTIEIRLFNNFISTFSEDAFAPFSQLELLNIGKNHFTELPNLTPVGGTLRQLWMSNCRLRDVNATVFSTLVALEYVNFRLCASLVSIADVPGPGSSLTPITFGLQNTGLRTFPSLTTYPNIGTVNLRGSLFTAITPGDVEGMGALGKLYLGDSLHLTELPDAPADWHSLQLLEIVNTQVTVIPLTCPSSTLTIQATSTGVSLCRCENVWLSALRQGSGGVTLDSLACGTSTTTDQLLQEACSLPPMNSEKIRMGTAELRHDNFFCTFPIQAYITGVTKYHCTGIALSTLGCLHFGFLPTGGSEGTGSCVIIAPTDTPLEDIPDASSTGWLYYNVYW